MRKKIIKSIFLGLLFGFTLFSCSEKEDENQSVNEVELAKQEIYNLAKDSGFEGTYEEWLESIKGDEVELKFEDGCIVWKYSSGNEWSILLNLKEYVGNHEGLLNLKDAIKDTNSFVEETITQLNENISIIDSKYATELSNLETKYNNDLEQLNESLKQDKEALEDLKLKYQEDLVLLKQTYDEKIESEKEALEDKISLLDAKYEEESNYLNRSISNNTESITRVENEYKLAIITLQENHDKSILDINALIDNTKNVINSSINDAVERIAVNEESISNIQIGLNEVNTIISNFNLQYNKDKEDLQNTINSLQERIEILENEIAKLNEIKTYKVTLNLNNGQDSVEFYSERFSHITEPATPSKDGYNFDGWVDDCGNEWIFSRYLITEDTNLYANYSPRSYEIMFDVNGGYYIDPIRVNYDSIYNLPTPEKDGYIFCGWLYNNNVFDNSGIYKYTNDITVIAMWDVLFTIKFDTGDSEVVLDDYHGITYNVKSLPIPQKDGYYFAGWEYNGELLYTPFVYNFEDSEIILKARWEILDPSSGLNVLFNVDTPKDGITIWTETPVNQTIAPEPANISAKDLTGKHTVPLDTNDVNCGMYYFIIDENGYVIYASYGTGAGFGSPCDGYYYNTPEKSIRLALYWSLHDQYDFWPTKAIIDGEEVNAWELYDFIIPEGAFAIKGYYGDSSFRAFYEALIGDNCPVPKGNNSNAEFNEDHKIYATSKFVEHGSLDDKYVYLNENYELVVADRTNAQKKDENGVQEEDTPNMHFGKYYEYYDVVFYNGDDQPLESQSVQYGHSATEPSTIPTKENEGSTYYTFVGWNTDYSNITSDLDVYPIFSENGVPFTYTENSIGITITGLESYFSGDILNIPDTISGKDVVVIGESAFSGLDSIKYVNLPSTLTSIGTGAFQNFTGAESITIPASVKSIGHSAFYRSGFKNIIFESNSILESVGMFAFRSTQISNISIPKSLKTAGQNWLSENPNLINVQFDEECALSKIEYGSFMDCPKLEIITLPKNINKFPTSNLFTNDTSLRFINILSESSGIELDLNILGNNLDSLEEINISENNPDYSSYNGILLDKGKKKIIAMPSCANMNNIPITADTIGVYSFSYSSMHDIVVPAQIITIENYAFWHLKAETVTFAEGSKLAEIGNSNFYECYNLVSLSLPNSLTKIPNWICGNSDNLSFVSIPESVTSIGNYAFTGCAKLENITLPSSLQIIGSYAFHQCHSIKDISIPSQVNTIDKYAFSECTNLEKLYLPVSLNSIGANAFANCAVLNDITYNGQIDEFNAIDVDSTAFLGTYTSEIKCADGTVSI